MDLDLTGRRAFISGSTQGIGYAIAESFVREGVSVILNGRTRERNESAVNRLRATVPGADVSSEPADL